MLSCHFVDYLKKTGQAKAIAVNAPLAIFVSLVPDSLHFVLIEKLDGKSA